MSLFDRLRPKWKHPDPAVRLAALGALDDPAVLESLVEQDPDEKVRAAALRAIKDESTVRQLALHSASAATRKLAVERLEDHALLHRIATSDPSTVVRAQARARCASANTAGSHLRDVLSKLQVAERKAAQTAEFCGTLDEVCQALSRDPRFFVNGDVASDDDEQGAAQLRDTTRVAWATTPAASARVVARFLAQARPSADNAPVAAGPTRFFHVKVWRTGEDRFDLTAEEKQFSTTTDAVAWSRASSSGPDAEPALGRDRDAG